MKDELPRGTIKRHVHSKIRNRLLIYSAISLALIIIIAYRIIVFGGGITYPVLVFAIGVIVGIFVSRMFNIHWDEEAEKVVSRLDIYGVLFLALYIAFEFFGELYIRGQFSGEEINTIIFSLISGVLLGRGFGIFGRIRKILREQEIVQ